MGAALRTAKQLSHLIESKPAVAICLSGRKEFSSALKELGISAVFKSLDFNHLEWMSAQMLVANVEEEELDKSTGMHVLKSLRGRTAGKAPVGDDAQDLLALLLKQHRKEFLLSKRNHYIVLQETAHTGNSLELVRKALVMNGIPKGKVVTAAFRASMTPAFPPDVCGERVFLKRLAKQNLPGALGS